MRKRLIEDKNRQNTAPADWLRLEELAEVEISSEDARHPIESALLAEAGSGWRAAVPGQRRRSRPADHPPALRTTAAASSHPRPLCRDRRTAYAGVSAALVWRCRAIVPRNRSPTVEFQPGRFSD